MFFVRFLRIHPHGGHLEPHCVVTIRAREEAYLTHVHSGYSHTSRFPHCCKWFQEEYRGAKDQNKSGIELVFRLFIKVGLAPCDTSELIGERVWQFLVCSAPLDARTTITGLLSYGRKLKNELLCGVVKCIFFFMNSKIFICADIWNKMVICTEYKKHTWHVFIFFWLWNSARMVRYIRKYTSSVIMKQSSR